jgi:hypothetical protein
MAKKWAPGGSAPMKSLHAFAYLPHKPLIFRGLENQDHKSGQLTKI